MSTHRSPIAGIVGGIGPESTIDYYRAIFEAYHSRGAPGAPRLVITSVDVGLLIRAMTAGRLDEVVAYLAPEIERLHRAGATFGVISANTPHIVFDELQAQSPMPLLSIVEAVADAAVARGASRLALFGTRFTMEASFYPDTLRQRGLTLARPRPDEIAWIHERYLGELLKGVFTPETANAFRSIADRMRRDDDIDALILGGTELPLLLRGQSIEGVVLIDSTLAHVDAIVSRLLE